MQNVIRKSRQNSIVFKKLGILSANLKTLTSYDYPTVQHFFSETSHTFSTYQCLPKGVWDFLKFYLDLGLFAKIINDLVSTHSFFALLLITQNLNRTKKIPHTLL